MRRWFFSPPKTGAGVFKLFGLIKTVFASATHRVTTGELNRFVEKLHFDERKILYITQAGVRPPSFVVFTDKAGPLHFSHERYLVNQLKKALRLRRNADRVEDPRPDEAQRAEAAEVDWSFTVSGTRSNDCKGAAL